MVLYFLFFFFLDSNSPNDFNYAAHPGFYDYFPGSHPHGPMTDFPGTVPIGPSANNVMEHANPLNNGVASLGADAPYISTPSDCLGSRSSPENVLSSMPDGSYGPNSRQRPQDNTSSFSPFMPNHVPSHMTETRVW
ncbi:uncharacterized protein TNCV_1696261 [Trichonephila clavipes]|nr:uncharacterized protein TNCV_1696261 [Trichonephila clavipes]